MESNTSVLASISAQHLRTEHLENPLGIDARRPQLSWQDAAGGRNVFQSAFQVQVAPTAALLDAGESLQWDSGMVVSDRSLAIQYSGPELRSGQRCYWRVRVWDQADRASDWSEPAWWEMGLLDEKEWNVDWIEVDWEEDPQALHPCPYLRRSFHLDQPLKSARLYITAHGLYEAWLNGQRVGDQVFTPGFTDYDLRLQYQVYDVTALLQPGENALGAILGDGWYRGRVYGGGTRNSYGQRLGLLALLKIETGAGQQLTIASDANWKASSGPILKSDMKDGENYDARLEMPGWNKPGYDAAAWKAVRIAAHPKNHLAASMGVPVRRKETFRPAVLKTPNGETVLDFGQNLAGVVRMQVRGPAGTTIRLRHGEALDKNGNFTVSHLMLSKPKKGEVFLFQEVSYTLKGEGLEEYEPRFTVHGFRYVQVTGYPDAVLAENFYAVATYSDMPPTGTFQCSDPAINQLHHNVAWSMKSNFLDIPTDCPTRERAGWTGDAQIFAPTASFLMDTSAFFGKWLADLKLAQFPNGMLGNFVPNPGHLVSGGFENFLKRTDGSSGWGDAAVMVPWAVYWAFGDRQVLERQYESMKAWVNYLEQTCLRSNFFRKLNPQYWLSPAYRARQNLVWDTGYHWGEWLEPGDGTDAKIVTGVLYRIFFGAPVVATAYFANSARILARTAAVLGKDGDAKLYNQLADRIKTAYAEEFIAPDGRIQPDRQASYVRVLAFDLAPAGLKPAIVEHLVRLIRASGSHIGTGFLSTVFLCQVLSDNGHLDVAYDLLNQKTIPSWLYAVSKGATTIWESWEGIREDGTPQLSLNHYSPGAIANFLHRTVAGISPAEPGYDRIVIHPRPGGGLISAGATYASVHGLIGSSWAVENGRMRMQVTIPANTRAVVYLPGAQSAQVTEGGAPLAQIGGAAAPVQEGQDTRIELGSGTYLFEYPLA